MKSRFITTTAGIALMCIMWGCKKDNFKAPESTITGRVVYQGQPVGVRSNAVQLELWQPGTQDSRFPIYELWKTNKIPVYVAQDGTFSIKTFDGLYKLTRLRGSNSPWIDVTTNDTIDLQLNGSLNIDVPVTPYFTLTNDVFTFNKADSTITGTFNISQVAAAGKAIEKISLSVSTTNIVDLNNQIAFASVDVAPPATALTAPVTLKIDIRPRMYPLTTQTQAALLMGDLLQKKYAFVRFGVKPVGVNERLYTVVKRIELQ